MMIRPEKTNNIDRIREINISAFGEESEASIIDAVLRYRDYCIGIDAEYLFIGKGPILSCSSNFLNSSSGTGGLKRKPCILLHFNDCKNAN